MNQAEWLACEFPFDMLRHLDGKIDDEFMRFSDACCRRIWDLITDKRSRAVIEATEAYLNRTVTDEEAGRICAEWARACEAGEVQDLAGGATNDAIESVYGLGYGHAAQVARAYSEAAGYAASDSLRAADAPLADITAAWKAAERAERLAQCELLRDLFDFPYTGIAEIA